MSERITIELEAEGQVLTCPVKLDLYTGQRNYIDVHLTFDSVWSDISARYVMFSKTGIDSLTVQAGTDGNVTIPWEMMDDIGRVYISLFGGDRLTTNTVPIDVYRSGYDPDRGEPQQPTKDMVDQLRAAADEALLAVSNKVDKVTGKGLSANDYTDADKAKVDGINGAAPELALDDGAGNTVTLGADGDAVVDTTRTSPIDPATYGETLGYKAALDTLTNVGNNTRGATVSLIRRLTGVDQSLTSYMLTTGLIELRTGTTEALNNNNNVTTTFSKAMSGTPQIVLLQAISGKTGVAAPKVSGKTATGFGAVLGGSTGTDTTCDYIAIRLNYNANGMN